MCRGLKGESKNDQLESMVGVASPANVSPNTPKADESGPIIICAY